VVRSYRAVLVDLAVDRAQANFTTKSSPRAALDIWNTGSSWPTGLGIMTGSPASAGAITRSASTKAAGDGPGVITNPASVGVPGDSGCRGSSAAAPRNRPWTRASSVSPSPSRSASYGVVQSDS